MKLQTENVIRCWEIFIASFIYNFLFHSRLGVKWIFSYQVVRNLLGVGNNVLIWIDSAGNKYIYTYIYPYLSIYVSICIYIHIYIYICYIYIYIYIQFFFRQLFFSTQSWRCSTFDCQMEVIKWRQAIFCIFVSICLRLGLFMSCLCVYFSIIILIIITINRIISWIFGVWKLLVNLLSE